MIPILGPGPPKIGLFTFEMEEGSPTAKAKHINGNYGEETQSEGTSLVAEGEKDSTRLVGQERREKVTASSFRYLFRLLAFHTPALAISFVLLWQNSTGHFWFDFETSVWICGRQFDVNGILHMLQIAAKIYELLVLLSLSAITLDIYRMKLIGTGLPLGLLTSGYRVGDLSYLKHSGLLSALNTRAAAFAIFTILASLLSVSMGPASAILIVPSTGWWQFDDSTSDLNLQIRLEPNYEGFSIDGLWPNVLGADWLNSSDLLGWCEELESVDYPQCPHYGLDAVNDWTVAWTNNRLSPNISVASPSSSSEMRRWLSINDAGTSKDGATWTTTASSVAIEVVGYVADYLNLYYLRNSSSPKDLRLTISPTDLYQPLVSRFGGFAVNMWTHLHNFVPSLLIQASQQVQSKCQVYDWRQTRSALRQNDTDRFPYWSMEGVECFNNTVCNGWKELSQANRQIQSQYWDYDPTAQVYPIFSWIDLADGPLTAFVKLPYRKLSDAPVDDEKGYQSWWFSVCTFVPYWTPSTMSLDISRTNVVEATTPYIDSGFASGELPGAMADKMIRLEREWVDLINIPVNDSRAARYASMSYDDPVAPLKIGAIESLLSNLFWPTILPPDGVPYLLTSAFDYGNNTVGLASGMEKILGLILVNALSLSTSTMISANPFVILERDHDSWTLLYPSAINPKGFDPTRLTRGNESCLVLSVSEDQGAYCLNDYGPFDKTVGDLEQNAAWNFTLDRFGYGSGIQSPTLTFAMSMVYSYLTVLLAYLVGLLAYCRATTRDLPVRIASWDDLQDIVALTWKSRSPEELNNTGAGIKPFSDIWKKRALVRVTAGNNLELVIGDGTREIDRVRSGVHYG
jgi:hypothetical protein